MIFALATSCSSWRSLRRASRSDARSWAPDGRTKVIRIDYEASLKALDGLSTRVVDACRHAERPPAPWREARLVLVWGCRVDAAQARPATGVVA